MHAKERALETLEAVARKRGREGIAAEAREARSALAKRRFNVAVRGQFKRGKSTLINALLGRELLPSDVAPITTAVTVVEHGPRESAAVRFVDGHEEEIGSTGSGAELARASAVRATRHLAAHVLRQIDLASAALLAPTSALR